MVTVSEVVHGLELLVDNADAGLVCAVHDLLDVLGGLAHGLELLIDPLGGFNGGLGVELGCSCQIDQVRRSEKLTRIGNLEEDALHDVAAIRALELELVALEQDIVEAPGGGGQNGVHTTLTLHDLEDEVDGALAGITGSPGLPGHGVGRVSVGTETLAVNPGLGDGIGGLSLVETEHLGDGRGGGDLDQDDVVEADLVVGVLQGENALNLVGLDHGLEDVLDLQDLAVDKLAASTVGAGDPVSDSKDTTHVVGRMAPLSSQPAVIVVQPADHGTNVEGAIDGIQLVGSTEHTGSVGDHGTLDDRTQQLRALLELQSFQTTADGVEEH